MSAPRPAAPPAACGLTRGEARCVEALAYLAPGGWQTHGLLRLTERAKEADLHALAGRGVVEHRPTVARDGRGGMAPGTGRLWRLTREGWALARACGWPAFEDDDDDD